MKKMAENRIELTRRKAFDLSSKNQIGSVLHKAADLLQVFVKDYGDLEKLRFASNSINNERSLVHKYDTDREVELLACRLSESIETTAKWIFGNEKTANETKQERETFIMKRENIVLQSSDTKIIVKEEAGRKEELYSDSGEENEEDSETSVHDFDNGNPRRTSSTQCKICGKCFKSAEYLRIHMKLHLDREEDRRPHECKVCGKRFAQKTTRDNHAKIHLADDHPDRQRNFKCDVCGMAFREARILESHKLVKHTDDEEAKRRFGCNLCDRRFTQASAMRTHRKTHLSDYKREIFECRECGNKYKAKRTLLVHMRTHMDNKDPEVAKLIRPHECDICGKAYRDVRSLEEHKRTKHSDDETAKRPYGCDICGKRFTNRGTVSRHKREHLPEDDPRKGQFECDICGLRFRQKGGLKIHKRCHLDDDELKRPFKCDECGERFTQKGAVSIHKMRKHLTMTDDAQKRKMPCDVCGKILSCAYTLSVHKQIHLDDSDPNKRPFKCAECGLAYRDSRGLVQHIQNKHSKHAIVARKFYDCPICDKRFAHAGSLHHHKKKHSRTHKNTSLGSNTKDEGNSGNENRGAWSDEEESDDYQSDSESDDNKDDVASMIASSHQN